MTTILIIEDEDHIRQNLAEILYHEGFSTLEAANGRLGVELALQTPPDLILCDVMMPELDGFEVLQKLQSQPATSLIPFIFITARTDRQSMRQGMDLGADDYITKPFTPDELFSAIQTRLAKQAAAQDKFKTSGLTASARIINPPEPEPLNDEQWSNFETKNIGISARNDPLGTTSVEFGNIIRGYQILEKIGEGGAGTVYKAYQSNLGRLVAIKILKQKYAYNIEFIRRFQTEAELVARLEHPHIIPLYDYWDDVSGIYIVMRWLSAGSLRATLGQGKSWPLLETSQLLDQVADALYVAHQVGIIHRDLKPDNILLDERRNAYLTDFGLAKNVLSDSMDNTSTEQSLEELIKAQKKFFEQQPHATLYITDSNLLAGTPAYLSPEQIRFKALSPQTDIYSLGIMLYEMLAGELPFSGNVEESITKHLNEVVPSLHDRYPHIPAAVDAVIAKATAKHWEDRYPDVLALTRDFRRACNIPAGHR